MKKICLVADVPNWAFDIISQALKEKLSNKYDIRVVYFDAKKQSDVFYEFIEENDDCDLIHFFWRKVLLQFETEIFKKKVEENGKKYDEYVKEKVAKISTGAYDFLGLAGEDVVDFIRAINNYCSNYCVTSKKLYEKYYNSKEFKNPTAIVHDICNFDRYKPFNLERFDNLEREIVVGWVGNSLRKVDGIDLKGFHTVIVPVIQELKEEGYNINEHYADRNEKWRAPEEMPVYYSEIDVCLCTSIHEGTPLPILEAMSCGVPVIATNVGVVEEVFGTKQKEFIIGDRKNGKNDEEIKRILKEKIMFLYNNRALLKELSVENQKSITEYDGGKIIKEYENYFDGCMK